MAMQPAIEVRQLTKTYAEGNTGTLALRGVDLEVHAGELLMLMGPSGSGKTTLLSIMGCILTASSGSVRIAGKEITQLGEKQLPAIRLEYIGFVFQGFNLFPTLTAGENVELMLDLKGVAAKSAKKRAAELLDQVGLGDKYASFPADLSGGQKQRIAIARALAGDPGIILADEPTAALDSHTGKNVMEMMRELAHQHNRAVVIVTHDSRVLDFADRIVKIEDGAIAGPDATRREPVPAGMLARFFATTNERGLIPGPNRICGVVVMANIFAQSFQKNRTALLIGLAAFLLTVSLVFASRHEHRSTIAMAAPTSPGLVLIAGPGRVEPNTEDIQIGSELSGRLKTVFVEEGDTIHRGQVLAELENADYLAQVESAKANVAAKDATLRKVINGARRQERNEAWSSVDEAKAVMENAQSDSHRRQELFTAGVVSREELDRYASEADVAKAKYEAAVQQHSLVDDRAREEDRSLAEADLQLAKAQLEEAQARYEKTFIRSPIDGGVLRKHHRSGESVSNSSTVPDPVLSIGDRKILRVRVDVDETDVSKVHVGQKAYVTADAFGKQKFWGHVVRVGQQLGPKNIRTDEPTERVDTKILETLVELDPGAELPDGLRVDAFIVPNPGEVAEAKPGPF